MRNILCQFLIFVCIVVSVQGSVDIKDAEAATSLSNGQAIGDQNKQKKEAQNEAQTKSQPTNTQKIEKKTEPQASENSAQQKSDEKNVSEKQKKAELPEYAEEKQQKERLEQEEAKNEVSKESKPITTQKIEKKTEPQASENSAQQKSDEKNVSETQTKAELPENIEEKQQEERIEQPISSEESVPEEQEEAEHAGHLETAQEEGKEAVVSKQKMPVKQAKSEMESYTDEQKAAIESVNIDTIDLSEPKGNWLLKRGWWQAAEVTYEQIKKILNQIFDIRLSFYNERTELDRTVFNNFFQHVGIGQGELQEIVESLLQDLEREKKDMGNLTQEEEDFMKSVLAEKENLKKLHESIQQIDDLEKSLNNALVAMRQQIDLARENELKAWENFKLIARELSDHKAYELYYAMNSFLTNVSEILKYLQGPFADYYRQLGIKAKNKINEVSETTKFLHQKGIDLEKYIEDQLQKQCKTKSEKEEIEAEHEEESAGFFDTIWHYIKLPFSLIGSLFSNTYDGVRSLFVKEPVEEESAQEA